MKILGIDPGYAILGYGIVEKNGNHFKPVTYGAITTKVDMMPDLRLKKIYDELMDLIEEFKPSEASIEKLFFNTNAKTAMLVSEARGVSVLACKNSFLDVFEYTPLQIKQALVGYGNADKKQVQSMVKLFLNLSEIPKPDDAADGLAAAICHGNSRKSFNIKRGY